MKHLTRDYRPDPLRNTRIDAMAREEMKRLERPARVAMYRPRMPDHLRAE